MKAPLSDWAPNADVPEGFPKGLSPDILPKGELSDCFAVARLAKPPPAPAFANEPKPPPEVAPPLDPKGSEPSGFPGVYGCPKLDLPNCGAPDPNAAGAPNAGVPKEGFGWEAPRADGLPNAGAADGFPKLGC